MKAIVLATALMLFLTDSQLVHGQVNVTINIDKQPVWGPEGFDHVDYYYLPEADVYYSVSKNQYIYLQNGKWVFRKSLPARHRNIDLYKTYKVVINENKPYLRHSEHRKEYQNFKDRRDQRVIKDSKDERYFKNKNHPRHKEWKKKNQRDQGPPPPRG